MRHIIIGLMMTHPPAESYTIYTDGASTGNPGPGGWAALIRAGKITRELSGGYRETTNNRMELMAAIMALESLPAGVKVLLYSDSSYLVQGITEGWAEKWRAKGWRQTKNRPTANADLWKRLLSAVEARQVQWEWVRGHAGHPGNEKADRLAQRAAAQKNLPPDPGYENTFEADSAQPGLFDPSSAASTADEVLDLLAGPPAVSPASRPGGSALDAGGKMTRPGQPCRKCGTPLEKRIPSRKMSSKQTHYYEWYLVCPSCGTMYLVDSARRSVP